MIGEPSGTAGIPMLNILQKNDLCNVLIIVTRYFGGILLGTGGLLRCYSNCTVGAIKQADIVEIKKSVEYSLELEYSELKSIEHYLKNKNINVINTEYGENIICNITVSEDFKNFFLKDVENKVINIVNIKQVKDNIYIKERKVN